MGQPGEKAILLPRCINPSRYKYWVISCVKNSHSCPHHFLHVESRVETDMQTEQALPECSCQSETMRSGPGGKLGIGCHDPQDKTARLEFPERSKRTRGHSKGQKREMDGLGWTEAIQDG